MTRRNRNLIKNEKGGRVRHVQARSGEHTRVHRPRSRKPDFWPLLIGIGILLCWGGICDVLRLIGTVIELTVIILFWTAIIGGVALAGYTVVQAVRAPPNKR